MTTLTRPTEADLDAAMAAVWEADDAWALDLDSREAKATYTAARAAYKALADTCDDVGWPLTKCDRCGGVGGWEGWPGFTCYDCGGSTKMPMKRVRFQAMPPTRAKNAAKAMAKAKAEAEARGERWRSFAEAHPVEAKFLDETFKTTSELDPDDDEGVGFDHFFSGLKEKVRKYGSLSDKQVECIRREMAKRAERAAAVEFPRGTATVEGEIVSLPETRGYAGGSKTNMLVALSGDHVGNRVMGTVPAKVWDSMQGVGDDGNERYGSVVGSRVRFSAEFSLSRDDEHFGFFKSPKQVEVTHVNWNEED